MTAPITPPAGALPAVPPGTVPPTTPVQQNLGPTDTAPLAPLNLYQNQTLHYSYQAPVFQGQNTFQAGNYSAPQINAPDYNSQSYTPT